MQRLDQPLLARVADRVSRAAEGRGGLGRNSSFAIPKGIPSVNKHSLAAAVLLASLISPVQAEPLGGQVRSGNATIQQTLGTTTVRQLTDRAIIDWQKFNVSPAELVKFVQPNEAAVILNRVTGGEPSRILGKLQANGQVFLVNPNGILFGPTSSVDVGSLVATTLSISNEDFLSGNYRFSQDSSFDLASVVNQGTITVNDQGYVILTAPLVSNEGLIVANLGQVHLGAGQAFTLNLDGRNLVSYQLDASQGDGTVVLTPDAVSDLLRNTLGTSGASRMVERDGKVYLEGGSGTLVHTGAVRSAGGLVETSGRAVSVTGDIQAPGGTWLIDPLDITIVTGSPSGPNEIQNTTINGQLDANTAVIIDATVAGPDAGNITQNAPIAKSTAGTADLTMIAGPTGDIVLNDTLTATTGSLNVTLTGGASVEVNANLSTNGGAFKSDGTGTFTSPAIISAGTVTIDHDGDVAVNRVVTPETASGIITVTGASIQELGSDPEAEFQTNRLNLTATNGIGTSTATLETATSALFSEVTGAGGIYLLDTLNGLQNANAVTFDGDIVLTSQQRDLNAFNVVAGGAKSITLSTLTAGTGSVGSIDVDNVIALGGSITLNSINTIGRSELGVDPESDIVADSVVLNAVHNIGSQSTDLYVSAPSLTATSTGITGEVYITNRPTAASTVSLASGHGAMSFTQKGGYALSVSAASSTSGSILALTNDAADIDAVSVIAAGMSVRIKTTTSGNLRVGDVSGGDVRLTAVGSIEELGSDAAPDITTATKLDLTAGTGVGALSPLVVSTATNVTANVTAGDFQLENQAAGTHAMTVLTAGNIAIDTQGTTTLTSVRTTGGDITVGSGGDLYVTTVRAPGHAITIDSQSFIRSTSSSSTNLLADTVTLTAVTGIGRPQTILTVALDAITASAVLSGAGEIVLKDVAGGLVLTQATAPSGDITVTGVGGDLQVGTLAASGAVSLTTTTSGNILADSVSGNSVLVTAAGSVEELGSDPGADFTATGLHVDLNAHGIGQFSAPEIAANYVDLETLGNGEATSVFLTGAPLTLAVDTRQGNVSVQDTSANSLLAFDAATSELSAATPNLLAFENKSGSARISNILADYASVTVSGAIDELGSDPEADITAATIILNANTGIGQTEPLELSAVGAAGYLNAFAGPGANNALSLLNEFDRLQVSANGAVSITGSDFVDFSGGVLNAENDGGTLVFITTSGDLNVAAVSATGGTVKLSAPSGSVQEASPEDPDVDIAAAQVTLEAKTGVGNLRPLEILAPTQSATTETGNIVLSDASGSWSLATVSATSGTVQLIGSGDIFIGAVNGTSVTVQAGGAIRELGADTAADITTGALSLTAGTGIGLLQIDATSLTASVSGAGSLSLADLTGNLSVTSATTSDGDITLSTASSLTATVITAGGDHDLFLTGGNITVGDVRAGDTITVNSTSLLAGTDAAADLTARSLDLHAANGIGPMQIDADHVSAQVSGTGFGHIRLSDVGDGIEVDLATTTRGDVIISSTGNLLAHQIAAAGLGSEVILTTTGTGNVELGSVSSSGEIAVTSAGSVTGNSAMAPTITLDATTGISGLELGTQQLLASTDSGGIQLDNFSDTAASARLEAGTGDVLLSQTGVGALTLTLAQAHVGAVDVQSTGNLVLVQALATTTARLSSTAGTVATTVNDTVVDVTAPGVTLQAATGISGIDLATTDLHASTAAGNLTLENHSAAPVTVDLLTGDGTLTFDNFDGGALTVTSAAATSSSAGLLRINNPGTLTVQNAAAHGALNVSLTATTGDLSLGHVISDAQVLLAAPLGAIEELGDDPDVDVSGTLVDLTAKTGIGTLGTLDLQALQIDADTDLNVLDLSNSPTANAVVALRVDTGAGAIRFAQQGFEADLTLSTKNGSIVASNTGGDLRARDIVAGGTSRHITLTTTGLGDIRVGLITALDDTALLMSAGSIVDLDADAAADFNSKRVTLQSVTGIGPLQLDAVLVPNAVVTGTGGVDLHDVSGGLVVTTVSTHEGPVLLRADGGPLTLTSGEAGGAGNTFTATASGDILVGRVAASGDSITLTSGGAILESGSDPAADLITTDLFLSSVSGIGAAGVTLETSAVRLTGDVTGAGRILVKDEDNLNAVSLTTAAGNINVTAQGLLNLGTVIANGGVIGTTVTAGNIVLDQISGTSITLTAVGRISETVPDSFTDLQATAITLSAGSGIGQGDALEIDADTLSAAVTGTGSINLVDVSGAGTLLTVDNASTPSGSVNLTASGGSIRANHVSGTTVNLTTNDSGSIQVDEIVASGSVNLVSAQNITEIGVDAQDDIIAGAASLLRAQTGVIATSGALEVTITGSTLSVFAGGKVGTASVKLAGTVNGSMSPTASLIHLNTPPGSSTFNGLTF